MVSKLFFSLLLDSWRKWCWLSWMNLISAFQTMLLKPLLIRFGITFSPFALSAILCNCKLNSAVGGLVGRGLSLPYLYLFSLDLQWGRYKWRWENWSRRVEGICSTKPIFVEEHDTSIFEVSSKKVKICFCYVQLVWLCVIFSCFFLDELGLMRVWRLMDLHHVDDFYYGESCVDRF